VLAALVDGLVLFVLSSLLLLAVGARPFWAFGHHHLSGGELAVRYVAAFVAALIYYPPLMRLTDGQTLGKRLLSIRVVRTDAQPMSFPRAVWREVAVKIALFDALNLAPVVGAVGGLAVLLDSLWPLWDSENRALHDMLALTRVRRAS
jgi:uncharacterized RDD family membrane protein YckC